MVEEEKGPELKPCPFCGNDKPFVECNMESIYIVCDCGVRLAGSASQKMATEAWNQRLLLERKTTKREVIYQEAYDRLINALVEHGSYHGRLRTIMDNIILEMEK